MLSSAASAVLLERILRDSMQHLLIGALSLPIIYVLVNEFIRKTAKIPHMNGPKGLPLLGNIWDIRVNAAEKYRQWAKQYGDVYQIMLGNIPVVVVNSASAAKSVFGSNAQTLSSRPELYTFHKVLSDTAGTTIGTSPYSDSLKRRRKGAASALNRPSVATYVPHLEVESRDFIKELFDYGNAGQTPVDPMPMIQRLSLSLALTLNWGTRLKTQKDDLFGEITHVEEEISKFRSTTGNLQDYIPILRLNPINFHSSKAREMRDRRDRYLTNLNNALDERIAAGTHQPCIQANVILDKETKLSKDELTSISLTMLSGGLDTVTTQVAWFVALLSQHPEIQEKAIVAIRKHYGEDQPMCDENDDQKCAYVVALVKEALRYYTVLRLALPRASVKDLPYQGTVIPKGTMVFLNAWACNMDEKVWTDPEVFRPERWLEQPDAPLFTYGVGYRMCAGSLLANRELYLVFIRLLNSFYIKKYDDVDCHPVTGNADPKSLVALPPRFKSYFVPRNDTALRAAVEKAS
ncbi:3-hydroxyphenylacetate 6-hydroxylase [Trichoderma guizhouense]|uniref:3-hydroxyphenylacetate 6-hydroxylase n=1 Tax=Trichoderma guizhouense TaxID=1491466 RepID=A0A1T3CI83_9HYPO|nr:3-hydroxyphenylacetate 6-hydroxylase [Trichoderma guizhouense]